MSAISTSTSRGLRLRNAASSLKAVAKQTGIAQNIIHGQAGLITTSGPGGLAVNYIAGAAALVVAARLQPSGRLYRNGVVALRTGSFAQGSVANSFKMAAAAVVVRSAMAPHAGVTSVNSARLSVSGSQHAVGARRLTLLGQVAMASRSTIVGTQKSPSRYAPVDTPPINHTVLAVNSRTQGIMSTALYLPPCKSTILVGAGYVCVGKN